MTYIKKIEHKIKALHTNEIVPFSHAQVESVSIDTLWKVLHRLHDKGMMSIMGRGHFKKEKAFSELLFIYGSLKKGFDNHHLLSNYAKRLGKAITVGKFGMFEDSFGNYPYFVPTPHYRTVFISQRSIMNE